MQEEQIRTALNARTGTRQQSAMQTRNTIFTMTMPFLIIPSRASESICSLAESSSRQAVRLKEQINVELLAFFSVQAATPEVVPKQDEWSTRQEYTIVR